MPRRCRCAVCGARHGCCSAGQFKHWWLRARLRGSGCSRLLGWRRRLQRLCVSGCCPAELPCLCFVVLQEKAAKKAAEAAKAGK